MLSEGRSFGRFDGRSDGQSDGRSNGRCDGQSDGIRLTVGSTNGRLSWNDPIDRWTMERMWLARK